MVLGLWRISSIGDTQRSMAFWRSDNGTNDRGWSRAHGQQAFVRGESNQFSELDISTRTFRGPPPDESSQITDRLLTNFAGRRSPGSWEHSRRLPCCTSLRIHTIHSIHEICCIYVLNGINKGDSISRIRLPRWTQKQKISRSDPWIGKIQWDDSIEDKHTQRLRVRNTMTWTGNLRFWLLQDEEQEHSFQSEKWLPVAWGVGVDE
jgi:hypothetical protein